MHYHAEVWIPTDEDVHGQVERALAPYQEGTAEHGFWDWWQIGGRWKGTHVPSYDAAEDPEHVELCRLCMGTGMRPGWAWLDDKGDHQFADAWAKECNGCNGCRGTGKSLTWPTKWRRHEADVMAVADVPDDLSAFTLVVGGKVFHEQVWDYEKSNETPFGTVKGKLAELGIDSGYLVTVDYHC